VIVATVGTHGQAFPRFFDLVRDLGDDVLLQYGQGPAPPGFDNAVGFLPFDELMARMQSASAVVTHAGVGSVLCARRAGHVPVVVPRLRQLGEHVDNHQAEFTRTLEAAGEVVAVWDDTDVRAAVAQAAGRRPEAATATTPGPLHRAVREALFGA
jgi:UDP-N-acetylglucosamine transferase subunit ALG13